MRWARGYAGTGDTRAASIHFITVLANTLSGAGFVPEYARSQCAGATGERDLRQRQRRELRLRFSRASCAACSACCRACNSVWSSFFGSASEVLRCCPTGWPAGVSLRQ